MWAWLVLAKKAQVGYSSRIEKAHSVKGQSGLGLRPKNTIVSCNLSLGCTKGKGACLTLNHNHRFIIIKHKLSPTLT